MDTDELDLAPILERHADPYSFMPSQAKKDIYALYEEVRRLREQLALPCGQCHPCDCDEALEWERAKYDRLVQLLGKVADSISGKEVSDKLGLER